MTKNKLCLVPSISLCFMRDAQADTISFSLQRGCLSQEHRCFAKYCALWTTVPVESKKCVNPQLKLPLTLLKPSALTCQLFSEEGIASYIFTYICCNINSAYAGENKKNRGGKKGSSGSSGNIVTQFQIHTFGGFPVSMNYTCQKVYRGSELNYREREAAGTNQGVMIFKER